MHWRSLRIALVYAATRLLNGAEGPGLQALQLEREANQAIEAGDFPAAREKLAGALSLRPDFPQLHLALASVQVRAGEHDDALDSLRRFAAFGLYAPLDRNPDFQILKGRREFQEVVKSVASSLHPRGDGEVAFSLREATGLIEGIAWREKTGEFLFGDVNARAVWARRKDGTVRRLTPADDSLLGVFGLIVDEPNGSIWAATSAVPEMRGCRPDQAGEAALVEIDLETGAPRNVFPVPRNPGGNHRLTDLALAEGGSVYVLDGGETAIWRLAPGARDLERWAASPDFVSLQALVVLPNGGVLVADQVNGLGLVEPARRTVRWLEPPPNTMLGEIRSLTLSSGGAVLALQTGTRPSRVLAIELDPEASAIGGVRVLEAGHIAMGAPSLGCLAAGDFYFVGNAGWSRFLAGDGEPTPPRLVPIFRTKLAARPK